MWGRFNLHILVGVAIMYAGITAGDELQYPKTFDSITIAKVGDKIKEVTIDRKSWNPFLPKTQVLRASYPYSTTVYPKFIDTKTNKVVYIRDAYLDDSYSQ